MKPAIEVTSFCNLRCKFCPFQHHEIDKGFMDMGLFKRLVDELAPVSEALMLFNRGEPFLHPRIYQMIEYANARCPIILATNAILVNVKKLYSIKGKKTIAVSCPAGNRETYEKLTTVDAFETVKGKIKELQKKKPDDTELYVKMVRQPENEGQDEKLREFCDNVVVIDDSNIPKDYLVCTQPDTVPVYRYDGRKVVCCRDWEGKYDWHIYKEQAKKRRLDICKNCGIC